MPVRPVILHKEYCFRFLLSSKKEKGSIYLSCYSDLKENYAERTVAFNFYWLKGYF